MICMPEGAGWSQSQYVIWDQRSINLKSLKVQFWNMDDATIGLLNNGNLFGYYIWK